MDRHVCRELLLYLTPIRLLQENTNHYSPRMGRKVKDLPSCHTLSLKETQKRVREQFQKSSRTLFDLFANSFLIVLRPLLSFYNWAWRLGSFCLLFLVLSLLFFLLPWCYLFIRNVLHCDK